ncbi:MAG: hypothetical protein K5838_03860 [Elusimicrobiales bacterium]|nr:hypothetical protein [Elusimicrobiales bacterium]
MNTDFLSSIKSFFQQKKIQEIISLSVILSAAFFSVFVILHNAEWILGDNYSFILTTAQGKPAPLLNSINIGHGRFFPLAGLDFNLLLLIPGGTSAFAHYLFVSFSFIIGYLFFCLFNKYFFAKADDNSIKNNTLYLTALSCILLIANGGFFTTIMNVIYSERLIFLLFALMMLAFLKERNIGKHIWFALAAASAIYAAYLKETVPPALFAFSFFSLIFFRKGISKAEKTVHYLIIINFMVFMSMWLYFGHTGNGKTYRSDDILPFWNLLHNVLWQHKIYLCILATAFCRCCAILFLKSKPVYLADPLLIASATYVCEYIVLKFNSDYYYFPAAVLGLPSLLYFVFSSWKKNENVRFNRISLIFRIASICMILLSFAGEITYASANINAVMLERAKVMPGLRMMAEKYAIGGKIYWFQPWDKDEKIFNLTELYINFLLNKEMGRHRGQNDSVLTVTETVPRLRENDIFLYMTINNDQFNADSATLSGLKDYGFEFCQFQTGYMIYTKGKCGLIGKIYAGK